MKKSTARPAVLAPRGLSTILLVVLFAGHPAGAQTIDEPAEPLPELKISLTETGVAEVPEPVTPPPTIQETLLAVCTARGYGVPCAKHLIGMAWKESNFKGDAKGDFYRGVPAARGWFQIHYRLHGISVECAEDLTCSANWTLDYLEKHGYPRAVAYAVQCHNSCNFPNGYAASALRHGERLWNAESTLVAVK